MPSIRDDVSAVLAGGRPRAGLSALARNWRQYRTSYAIENAIQLATDEGRGDDLHDTILDEEFRGLRERMFGVNALRADLHMCGANVSANNSWAEPTATRPFGLSPHY